jgi:hypothetical protein
MAATRLFFAGMLIANAAANLLTKSTRTFYKNNGQIMDSNEINKSMEFNELANDGFVNNDNEYF